MDCLYLRETFRGMGLGQRLIARLARFARRNSIAELQWQTPLWNDTAASFYRHLGATEQVKRRYSWRAG